MRQSPCARRSRSLPRSYPLLDIYDPTNISISRQHHSPFHSTPQLNTSTLQLNTSTPQHLNSILRLDSVSRLDTSTQYLNSALQPNVDVKSRNVIRLASLGSFANRPIISY